ncbi:hypothetical protein FSP39_006467 [Pinctada imbricata]|uniref:PHD-type domain-containing protein n=1 Tax=Pinctada imbricata TaxID=66713 RepID=A0AA88YN61_PINIB|nr:hypothetical protein FSP39_006467 [Pinctada imbricata]
MLPPKRSTRYCLTYIFYLLVLNSSDCHPNPGPRTPKYPCGDCGKAVKWSKTVKSVACTQCETWFHKDCLGMSTAVYLPLENTDLSWYCCNCGIPNFNSSLFSEFDTSGSNLTSSTPNSSSQSSSSFFGDPILSSSPKQPVQKNHLNKKARVLTINFQSMRSKREAFWSMLENSDPDIILASETWLNPSIHEREVLPDKYVFAARRERPNGSHGGVAIITKASFDASEIALDTSTEMVAASIPTTSSSKPVIVCSVFRPPSSDEEYTKALCDTLHDIHEKHRDHIIWIGGDTDLSDINWACDSIESHSYLSSVNQAFIDTFTDLGCQQVIDFPTRGENILDIFATNRPSLVNKATALPGLGDHDIVLLDTNIIPQQRRPIRRLIYIWSKADTQAIAKDLSDLPARLNHLVDIKSTVDSLWSLFKTTCTKSINSHVPSKYTSTRFNQPWCDSNIRRLSRRKKRAFRKAKQTKRKKDWENYRTSQNNVKNACKTSYNRYVNNIISEEGYNNKKLYSFIKSKKCDSTGVSPLRDGENLHSNPKDKAEILNRQFSSVFTQEKQDDLPQIGSTTYPAASNITVTEKGVLKLLNNLNPNKASGPDQISSRFLRTMSNSVAPILTIIFQASSDQGKVPDDWKSANVTPLFKKGDRARASNYRPVSLTSVCCKTLEHIVHRHVITHLEEHNILTDQQHGFRKRRSCESQLITTIHDLASGLNQR